MTCSIDRSPREPRAPGRGSVTSLWKSTNALAGGSMPGWASAPGTPRLLNSRAMAWYGCSTRESRVTRRGGTRLRAIVEDHLESVHSAAGARRAFAFSGCAWHEGLQFPDPSGVCRATARTDAHLVCSRPTSTACRRRPCPPRPIVPSAATVPSVTPRIPRQPVVPSTVARSAILHAQQPAPRSRPRPSPLHGRRRRWQYWPPAACRSSAAAYALVATCEHDDPRSRPGRRSDAGKTLQRRRASRPGDRCRGIPAAARSRPWPARLRGRALATGARAGAAAAGAAR